MWVKSLLIEALSISSTKTPTLVSCWCAIMLQANNWSFATSCNSNSNALFFFFVWNTVISSLGIEWFFSKYSPVNSWQPLKSQKLSAVVFYSIVHSSRQKTAAKEKKKSPFQLCTQAHKLPILVLATFLTRSAYTPTLSHVYLFQLCLIWYCKTKANSVLQWICIKPVTSC